MVNLKKDHPLWSLIRLIILMVSLCGILYLNSTTFDDTEIKSLIMMFLVASGFEGIPHLLTRKR